MKELLVLLSCFKGYGCLETTQAYYQSEPELQYQAELTKNTITKKVGDRTVSLIVPALYLLGGQSASIKITKNSAIQLSTTQYKLGYSYEF